MAHQVYNIVSIHDNEISGCTIISRLIHLHAPYLVGMNVDVQSDMSTLSFNKGELIEDFNSIILRLQQQIIFLGENLSPTSILFRYTKALSKIKKIKAFMAPKIKDPINSFTKTKNMLST